MISPELPDDTLRSLFNRKPELSETTLFWLGMSDTLVTVPDEADTQEVQTVDLDADLERLIAEIDANAPAPKPEPSLLMQAVSGFFSGLVWHLEDQTPLDRLSDAQQDIIRRVREIVQSEDPSLAETKNAE